MSASTTTEVEQQPHTGSSTSGALGPTQGDDLWSFDFFGCLGDWKMCLATFCVPCYTLGRNAAYFGENCWQVGLMCCLGVGFPFAPLLRWRIRQAKNIRGSMTSDVLAHVLCPCCALIQENRELYGMEGSHIGEKIPLK